MLGVLGVLALGYGVYLYFRGRRASWQVVLSALGGGVLVLAEVYARVHPAPPAQAALQLSPVEQTRLRLQLAESELRAKGFAVPRTGGRDHIVVADGDFVARIVPEGAAFRLELSEAAPISGLSLEAAVQRLLAAHPPKT